MTPTEIKKIRIDAGLTQIQLADFLGLSSQNYISKYESGERNPSNQTIKLLELLKNKKIKPPSRQKAN